MWSMLPRPSRTAAYLGKGLFDINDILAAAHGFVATRVKPGATCIDATAGNGHDTLFLAQLVGPNGSVYAFDIQSYALSKTEQLLVQHNVADRTGLHLLDHAKIDTVVNEPVQAAMFNLGYLPGGSKDIITDSTGTLIALQHCLKLLADTGIVSVVTYSGHPGGQEEEQAVANWCQQLPAKEYNVTTYQLVNKPNNPPKLWLISTAVR